MMKTRLAKLETAEHERLCNDVKAAETTIVAMVRTFFTEPQLQILDLLCKAGDVEIHELSEEDRQSVYARRRQQASLEALRQSLTSHQWLIAQLQALQTKGTKHEATE